MKSVVKPAKWVAAAVASREWHRSGKFSQECVGGGNRIHTPPVWVDAGPADGIADGTNMAVSGQPRQPSYYGGCEPLKGNGPGLSASALGLLLRLFWSRSGLAHADAGVG